MVPKDDRKASPTEEHEVLSMEGAEQIHRGHPSEEEKRWSNFWDFFAAAVCFLMHPHASATFTLQLYSRGGAFALFFAVLAVTLGGPMLLFEVALGQSTLSHAVDAFRICPIVQGLGYGMLVCTVMMMLFENVALGSSGVFAVIALTTPSDKPEERVAADEKGNNSVLPMGYNYYEKFIGSIHFIHGTGTGPVHGEMLISVIFSWVLILLGGFNVSMHYCKTVSLAVVVPLSMLLVWLSSTAMEYPGGGEGVLEFFGVKTLPDFEMVVMALLQVLVSLGLGCGALVHMGSLARFRWPSHSWWAYGLVALVVLKELAFAALAAAALGAAAAERQVSIHSLVHMEMIGLELKVLSISLEYASFPHFWGTFVFVLFWLAELYYVMLLLKWATSGLKSLIRTLVKTTRRLHVPVTLTWCLLCVTAGIVFSFRNTVGYGVLWELYQPNWAIGALCMTEMIAGVYCFGPRDLYHAFEMSMGYYPDWYTRVCWLLLPVLITIAMLVSLNVAYARRTDPDRYTCSRVDCLDGLPSMVTVLVPIAIVALHNIRVYTLKGTITELVRPRRRGVAPEQREHPEEDESVHGESLDSGLSAIRDNPRSTSKEPNTTTK